MTLQPQANFTVVRQLSNHLDTATYYVRAVIRNAYTDEILDTLNLTDKGGQRFKYDWQVPADSLGQGFYISIVTSVYTDSGYTTKSENYGDDENTYLVQDRLRMSFGGGGTDVDYERIKRIIKENVVIPEFPQIDIPQYEMKWDEVLSRLSIIEAVAKAIPTEQKDLTPALESVVTTIKQHIDSKEVTPETDLTEVSKQVDSIIKSIEAIKKIITSSEEVIVESVKKPLAEMEKNIIDTVSNTTFSIAPSTAKMEVGKRENTATNEPEIDINKLSI